MPNPRRLWTDYPSHYLDLAKSVAITPPPVLFGPLRKGDAFTFRRGWYNFRDALHFASLTSGPDSHAAQLYGKVEILSVKVEPSDDDPKLYNVIFDLHPIVVEMEKLNPAARQVRQLAHAQFTAAQRPAAISTPIFSDEEMSERLREINGE